MGNYSCYNCGKEFWTMRGERKHHENHECPRITPEMIKNSQEPYKRIMIEIYDVVPAIKKDRFMQSAKFEVRSSEDLENVEKKMIMEMKKLLNQNFNEYSKKDLHTQ